MKCIYLKGFFAFDELDEAIDEYIHLRLQEKRKGFSPLERAKAF
ncbi:hypothetical protein AB1K91_09620 [Terribacillus sp. 179-K 1B1 HS]